MPIVSLTAIPPRFAGLGPVLTSLLDQSARIDEVRLYIPRRYRRYPDYDGTAPDVPKGVNVIRVADDLGPASKFLFAAQDLAGQDVPILFGDDDRLYSRGWARALLRAHRARPDHCIACFGAQLHQILPDLPHPAPGEQRRYALIDRKSFDLRYRLRRTAQRLQQRRLRPLGPKPPRRPVVRAGYTDVALGYGGVLILPDFIDSAFLQVPDDLWMVDDILLSGHLTRRGIGIWLPKRMERCGKSDNAAIAPLQFSTFLGADRAASNRRGIDFFRDTYGIWRRPTGGRAPRDTGDKAALAPASVATSP